MTTSRITSRIIPRRQLAERAGLIAQYDPAPPIRAGTSAEASPEAVRQLRAMNDYMEQQFKAARTIDAEAQP